MHFIGVKSVKPRRKMIWYNNTVHPFLSKTNFFDSRLFRDRGLKFDTFIIAMLIVAADDNNLHCPVIFTILFKSK